MVVDPTDQTRFRFIRISVMGLAVDLSQVDGLAIDRAVSIKREVAVSFFAYFL